MSLPIPFKMSELDIQIKNCKFLATEWAIAIGWDNYSLMRTVSSVECKL